MINLGTLRSLNRIISVRRRSTLDRLRRQADQARDDKLWLQAASLYSAYLHRDPENGPIHVQAGHMFKEAKQFRAAETHYIQARLLMPDDADLALQLGHFYKTVDRIHEAFVAYSQAAALAPGWGEPRRELEDLKARVQELLQGSVLDWISAATVATAPSTSLPNSVSAILGPLTEDEVHKSGLFDARWYRRRYSDVQQRGIDPLRHFVTNGATENRSPGPGFEPEWYRQTYPEVNASGLDAFTHYVRIGRARGAKPAGPPPYTRWVEKFDTLTDQDRADIDRHIASAKLASPIVVVVVRSNDEKIVTRALRALAAQRLKPAGVLVCLQPGCPDAVVLAVRAVAGSDPLVQMLMPGKKSEKIIADGPVLLFDAGVELREHATYLFATFWSDNAAMAYADSDQIDPDGNRTDPAFKPDASPELMRQTAYVGPCIMLPASFDTASLVAQLTAATTSVEDEARRVFASAERTAILHIPFICYHNHNKLEQVPIIEPASTDADGELPSVTIIIPTRDRVDLLRRCVDSIWDYTDYPRLKIDLVVVDNGSEAQATADYLAAGVRERRLRVIDAPIPFNFSRLNNIAASTSTSDLLLLLNNDTIVEDPRWLRRLAYYAMQPDVAAVGPKLLYEDGTIQHAGVVLGIGGIAEHAHRGLEHDHPGAMGLAQCTHEVSVVTGACLAIRRNVFNQVGGLDENLAVAFNDVLLCLACLERGYRNLYVHDIWVRHTESQTRGLDDTEAKIEVFVREARYARSHFPSLFRNDPFYNPNLSLETEAVYGPAFPPRIRRPWSEARNRVSSKLLLLTGSLSELDDIGPVVMMQARYLSALGYDVTVGSPIVLPDLDLGGSQQVEVKRPEDAAIWAMQNDCDAIVVHTWPYLKVARLLGDFPKTILYDHGSASLHLTPSKGDVWAAKVEYALTIAQFSIVLAASQSIASAVGRDDVLVCSPGSDRLGRWSVAMMPMRKDALQFRGWTNRIVIVAGGLSGDGDLASCMLNRLGELAASLSSERNVIAVVTDLALQGLPNIVLLPRLSVGDLAAVYAATDLYLDLSESDVASLGACEAAALGAKVIPLELLGREIGVVRDRLIEEISGTGQLGEWTRRSIGSNWNDALAKVEAALAAKLGRDLIRPVPPSSQLLSDAVRIMQSGLFDVDFYVAQYPGNTDVAADPIRHYMVHGWRENRRPSALFHSDWYRATYPEVEEAGVDPLSHYLSHPESSRNPNRYFSNAVYLKILPQARKTGLAPLVHYLRSRASGAPSYSGPDFDPVFYAAAYPEVASDGTDLFLHFLTEGERRGFFPIAPVTERFDPYVALWDMDGQALISWEVPKASAITDEWSAARFCIGLLCRFPTLRERFPDALSAGATGSFASWLTGEGGDEQGLSAAGKGHVTVLFSKDIAGQLMQAYLTSPTQQAEHPFALTPAGLGKYVRHLIETLLIPKAIRAEQLLWFAIARSENPRVELVRTWQFSPPLQSRFPLGITLFGRSDFAAWLRGPCGLRGEWLDPTTWPETVRWTDQIRMAWDASSEWQAAHPDPFRDEPSARAFLTWLTGQPTVPEEARRRLWQETNTVSQLITLGLNVLGHFGYPSGLRTSVEALIEGYRRLGQPVATRDVWVQEDEAEPVHAAHGDPEIFDTTLIHVQPEPLFDAAYERAGLRPRKRRTYRIGYWYWELDTIPPSWTKRALDLDEIWTATRFVAEALRKEFNIPVIEIMPGVEMPDFEPLPRSYFNLPHDQFLFLFIFHMTSVMERKNPLGLIRAFRLAFPGNSPVGLVLKTSFGAQHPELLASLHQAAKGSRITIIDSVYTQTEVLGLLQSCDAYVSLHRSEGYGLTMAEAMLLGKPVVATNYSGNLDFMSHQTSLLVECDLVRLDRQFGPYAAGTRWAEPSIEHAADCMRRIVSNRSWARELGCRAQEDLLDRMSYRRSGALMQARLREIAHISRRTLSPFRPDHLRTQSTYTD